MDTLGNRIRNKRKEYNLTQKDLAKAVGVSHVTISQWESDVTNPKGENLHILNQALKTDAGWLLFGTSSKRENSLDLAPPSFFKSVPLISWVQAGNWAEIENDMEYINSNDRRETTAKVGKLAFALRVMGDSMVNPYGYPSIPEGAIIIVDPDLSPDNGKIVVARLNDTNEATLKKLIIDGPNKFLKPLNPDYKPIPMNDNCTIVGVVIKVEFDL